MTSWNDSLEGLGACAISSLLFGSMFVPLKKQNPGDGIFVQWVMGASIFCVGMIVNASVGFPTFHPLAMLGGALWAIGNVTAVPIISMIGMGMGLLIWGTMNCVCGWLVGRFGFFGIEANIPNNVTLNYIGLILVLIGGILFSRVHPNSSRTTVALEPQYSNSSSLRDDDEMRVHLIRDRDSDHQTDENNPLLRTYQSLDKRLLGIALSLLAGVFYGVNFVPVIYIQQHPDKFKDVSNNGLSYVFAHYCGIFITTTVFLLIYIVCKRNRPYINNQTLLPAFITGSMWAIAQAAWFVANDRISQAISFPINAMMPGVCAALWSVFYFREIQGSRNFRLLFSAISVTVLGAVLVALSKSI
ncbi:unnamed protein product [Anisakis simplex]|uniref:Transmembrane protein 144 homolog (inferred by orthology to a C. elegans protein) n=1 Tax=Anisakis simplex TaxID=6269 RepID=A0A0M3K791_ANISI|nr:unnamed protein product [Anisakis simplex]